MPERDLELLLEVAEEADRIASRYWIGDNGVWEKGPDDPVSEADIAVDSYLRETLLSRRSDYGWLSEETEDTPSRLRKDRVFVVDPIDGTRSFVSGKRTWAISLAVVERGKPIAGVVSMPMREKVYAASLGSGASLNGKSLHCTDAGAISQARVLSNRKTLDPDFWLEPPEFGKVEFRPSLAYRFCLVAEGAFDAMITLRNCWEWDVAAGAIIASEAGALVTDRSGARPGFNSRGAQTDGMIVANAALHEMIIALRKDAVGLT